MNLRLADLGTYLYLGLVALGTFSYQERYIFICGAGFLSYIYKPMAGMGLAALGPEKYIGRCPGHKQVLRSGNSRYTGRADYDLAQMRPQLQFLRFENFILNYSNMMYLYLFN